MHRLSNGIVEVEVSIDFGPRVMRYARCGGPNVFAEVPHLAIPTSYGPWKPRGGHRLWVAPEHMPGSYAPDDRTVLIEAASPLAVVLRQKTDLAGIQKLMGIRLSTEGTTALVEHTIVNRTSWPIRIAPWAITTVAPGTVFIPQPRFRPHPEALLPAETLALWPYTDLTDRRWAIGRQLIALTPDAARPEPQKIGVGSLQGWCALVQGRTVFMKRITPHELAEYPDRGSNIELFTAGDYLEIETLGPLQLVPPDASATHVERWDLFEEVEIGRTEESRAEALARLAQAP
jgi:hypothetical protein